MSLQTARKHPALQMFLLTFVLLGLTVLLGFIAVFVPWAMKDLAPGQRAWAYPFKTCIEDTFSPFNAEACQDNDFIAGPGATPLTGGNSSCKAYILTTIAFVFISVIGGVVLLLLLAFILLRLYSRPTKLAAVALVGLVLIFITACLAWIFFIVYASTTCAPDSIFPVHGYSYGFIIYIFASLCALGAVVCGFLAYKKLKNFQPLPEGADEMKGDDLEQPPSPISYPVYEPDVGGQAPNPSFTEGL